MQMLEQRKQMRRQNDAERIEIKNVCMYVCI